MTDDVRKLLGGYATGTLTEEEKKALFDAALHDDALFAALADEQALKELLEDSAVRAQVLRATEEPRFTVSGALREWFEHPKSKALAATGVVLLAVIGFQQFKLLEQRNESSIARNVAKLQQPDLSKATGPADTQSASPDQLSEREEVKTKAARVESPSQPPQPAATAVKPSEPSATRDVLPAGAASSVVERDETIAAAPPAASPPAPPLPAAPGAGEAMKKAESTETLAVTAVAPTIGAAQSLRASAPPSGAPSSRGPVALGAFQRAAGTSVTPLRYELLRRNAAGNFDAVPADYLFVSGDSVRLRVTSSRDGLVGISSNGNTQTASGAIAANTSIEVPATGGFSITSTTEKLIVVLSPTPVPTAALMDTAEARAKRSQTSSVYLEIPIRQKKP